MRPEGKRILVAGVGNVFHGDDAFGVEVVRRLAGHEVPSTVQVTDFGIRGYDLAFAMQDGYEAVVLVDAASREKVPGSLFLLDAAIDDVPASGPVDAHSLNPYAVLSMVKTMGGYEGRLFVVGCEPASLDPDADAMGLSEPVEAAVEKAVELVKRLVAGLLNADGVDRDAVSAALDGVEATGGVEAEEAAHAVKREEVIE